MRCAVRSPSFRPQAFGVTEWIYIRCFRLKAGLRTDYLRRRKMRFEYLTTFVPMDYESADRGVWIFKEELPPREPIVESLTDNLAYTQNLNRLGNEGWELVSVQPLLKGVWRGEGNSGLGYSLTAGYYLFWKRAVG